jgi:hypothetical protein
MLLLGRAGIHPEKAGETAPEKDERKLKPACIHPDLALTAPVFPFIFLLTKQDRLAVCVAVA